LKAEDKISDDNAKKAMVIALRVSGKDLGDRISDPRFYEFDSTAEEY
jgi:hypothetical protein